MTVQTPSFTGPYVGLTNMRSDSQGSIHDPAAARSLGFRGGFVPGSTVATRALTACEGIFGPEFFEQASYTFNFVSPVYEEEGVRARADYAEERAMVSVETSSGRVCCSGLANRSTQPLWADKPDQTAEHVFPALVLGAELAPTPMVVAEADVTELLNSAGVASTMWQGKNTGGQGLLHPEYLHGFALRMGRDHLGDGIVGVKQPGMWAGHALVIREPMFLGQEYLMSVFLADKGRSGRALFVTYEFAVADQAGTEVARGRHRIKWLAADAAE